MVGKILVWYSFNPYLVSLLPYIHDRTVSLPFRFDMVTKALVFACLSVGLLIHVFKSAFFATLKSHETSRMPKYDLKIVVQKNSEI